MGVAYRAEDTALGRFVALKSLSDDLVHDAQGKLNTTARGRAASIVRVQL